MKVLFIGDISGKPGRKAVRTFLPSIVNDCSVDFVIANAENAAGGRGVTRKVLDELMSYGIEFFTSGDHVWRHEDFLDELNNPNLPIIRPANLPGDIPYGRGIETVDLGKKGLLTIINIQGSQFMREVVDNPFWKMDQILDDLEIKDKTNHNIVVDFHAETTSEKIAMGLYLDGKISALLGTHTHVPTADQRVLPEGTAYVTDVGMTGPRDAVLWVRKEIIIHNNKYPFKKRFEIEEGGEKMFNSVLIEMNAGKAKSIIRIDKSGD